MSVLKKEGRKMERRTFLTIGLMLCGMPSILLGAAQPVEPTSQTPYFVAVFKALGNRELGQAYKLAAEIKKEHGDAEFQRLSAIIRATLQQDIANPDIWQNFSRMLQEEIRPATIPTTTISTTPAAAPQPSLLEYWSQPDIQSKVLARLDSYVRSVAFSPNGKLLASGGLDDTIRLWNIETGTQIHELTGHTSCIQSVAFSPNGKLLASGSDDHSIRLWNIENCTQIQQLTGHTSAVLSVAFSPDGKLLASGSFDNTIRLWNVATGTQIRQLTGHTEGICDNEEIYSVTFSPDGKLLASGACDNTTRLWDVETGTQIRQLIGRPRNSYNAIQSVAFSPNGRLLAAGAFDDTIRLWNVETGTQIRQLLEHPSDIESVAFSPDSKLLTAGVGRQPGPTMFLIDATTGNPIQILTGHTGSVKSVAFSPDGKLLASGSLDNTIRLWRPAGKVEGECPVCFEKTTLVRCGACSHYICPTCKKAIQDRGTPACPMCRKPLS